MNKTKERLIFMEISISTVVALGISTLFTLILPIPVLIFACVKKKLSLRPFLFGALAFFISQIILRIPLLNILSTQSWFQSFAQQQMLVYLLALCFTAGLFEETARLIGAKYFCKRRREYRDAISFGIGHGMCEVLLLIGLSALSNFLCSVMINSGTLATAVTPAIAQQITASLAAVSSVQIYLGIVERFSAVLFHIFATVLIFQGVNRGHSFRYWLLAILSHMAFNLIGVLLGQYTTVWISEIALLLLALSGFYYVMRARKGFSPAMHSHDADPV